MKDLIRKISDEMATEIMTFCAGEAEEIFCQRIQLMRTREDGHEINMGGRNKGSVVAVIKHHLKRYDALRKMEAK